MSKYRIVTNGERFKVQQFRGIRLCEWFKPKWRDCSYEYKRVWGIHHFNDFEETKGQLFRLEGKNKQRLAKRLDEDRPWVPIEDTSMTTQDTNPPDTDQG